MSTPAVEYTDYRDMVIDDLGDEIARTRDALVAALQDRDAYRLLAVLSIGRVAQLTVTNERLQQRLYALADLEREQRNASEAA